MSSVIKEAILNRRKLRLRYRGHSYVIEPHTFGLKGNGKPVLLAYQLEADDGHGYAGHWTVFNTTEFTSIELLASTFQHASCRYPLGSFVFESVLIHS